ncbi:MAG: hypothetical protein ACQEVA_20965 [Myxococcota bacterium]
MNSTYLSILLVALVTLAAAPAAAQVPDTLPVQGFLTDADDAPIDGTTTVTFRLYDNESGGSELWSETRDLEVREGRFSVYLGTQTPVDASLFTGGGDRYLGVTVGNGEELTPRFTLGTVPYAQVAEFAAAADTLQGLTPDDFARAGDVGWDELADIPGAVSDIAALNCTTGQFAVYDGSNWSCADPPGDTLAGLNCATDQSAVYDGTDWRCADPPGDTLAGLSCATDEVAAWDGSAWTCAERDDAYAAVASSGAFTDLNGIPSGLVDGDDDMLAGLNCAAGEVAAWDGAAWVCSSRDATYAAVASSGSFNDLTDVPAGLADGDDDTLAGLNCNADEVAAWDGSAWTCAARDDTYAAVASTGDFSDLSGVPTGLADGDDDALGALTCSTGEVAAWNGTTASWECAARDQTYAAVATSGDFADLNNIPAGLTDGDDDTLAGLSCASAEVAKWTGTAWACAADTDTTLDEATVDSYVSNNGYLTQTDADARYVQEGQSDAITSAMIADGEITDADVAAGAAIAPSKIAGTAATLTGDQNFDNGTLQIDATNDRVGVGAAPTSKLEVAGTAKADEFGYRGRTTSYEFVAAVQFKPSSYAVNGVYISDNGLLQNNNGDMVFFAAVDVPHGSRLDGITCYAPGGNIIAWELKTRAHDSTTTTVLASGDNTTRTASLSKTVDLSAESYFILAYLYSPPFSGCRITYSTDRVLP